MAEYIITIKQLATVIAKCHGMPLADKGGNPIFNSLEIDGSEVVELPEIVRCRDCKHYEYWEFRDGRTAHDCARGGDYLFDTEPDGFCKWAERRNE